jgi:hypothetical protein
MLFKSIFEGISSFGSGLTSSVATVSTVGSTGGGVCFLSSFSTSGFLLPLVFVNYLLEFVLHSCYPLLQYPLQELAELFYFS